MPPLVPYRFERTHACAEVRARYDGVLAPGDGSGETVSVAGRIMLSRPQGKIGFFELRDESGAIQLFATEAACADFDALRRLNLGDWVGATGEVVRTKRGELSVQVATWVPLAGARRAFGDKWRGVTDVDLRYRQREVDLWANAATRDVFLARSKIVSLVRRRLAELGFVEVETPMLHPIPGGAHARPFVTHHHALDMDLYLRIAPELYLKRLVVGGFERVFEIGRVFRNEGLSTRHNPEFTLLELYQAYADYTDLMALTEELVSWLAIEVTGSTTVVYDGRDVDLAPPWRRAGLEELITEHTGVAVSPEQPVVELAKVAADLGVPAEPAWGPGKLVLEIYEKTCEAELWGPIFVCDYPAEVSPLARRHRSLPERVERFEAIVAGRELANAFSELVDPDDQRARFSEQAAARLAGDDEAMLIDEDFLRALEHGMPPTAGLGIGIDRLVMLLTGTTAIRDVVLFPTMRPEHEGSTSGHGAPSTPDCAM